MRLSVIIVNYNVKYFLEQCLHAVLKAIDHLQQANEAEIIVFDNASSDGSKGFFQQKFPGITYIYSSENLGFAKANNKALQIAKGKYILFLNPDTVIGEDALEKSIAYLEKQNNGGALGIRMIDGSGNFLPESKRGFPTPVASFFKMSGLIKLFPLSKKVAHYYAGHLSQYNNNEVDVLSGAYMLVKKEVLDKTGGFDEAFFMYGEDIDLSYRIQQAGYKNFYFSDCTIIHFKGESANQNNAHYVKVFYQAMNIFVHKHFKRASSWWYILFIKSAILLSGVFSFIKRLPTSFVKKRMPQHLQALIISATFDKENLLQILQKYNFPERKISFLEKKEIVIEHLQPYNEVIMVANNHFSYQEIISLWEKLPKNMIMKIHAGESDSIVGSSLKTSKGDVLHK